MTRGDGGKKVFETDDDQKAFVFWLGQVGVNRSGEADNILSKTPRMEF